jgi:VIT1/CCC1 family predicted Fe2+/Mn2+ transporter
VLPLADAALEFGSIERFPITMPIGLKDKLSHECFLICDSGIEEGASGVLERVADNYDTEIALRAACEDGGSERNPFHSRRIPSPRKETQDMNSSRSPLATLAYFIVGLVVLIVVVQILGGLLRLISQVVSAALTIVLIVAVGYVVWLLIKAAYKSLQ